MEVILFSLASAALAGVLTFAWCCTEVGFYIVEAVRFTLRDKLK